MLRNVFLKTLRDQRTPLLWWAVGMTALGLYMGVFYPSIAKPEFVNLLEMYPASIKALLGEMASLATPEGYVDAYMFSMMVPLLFLIYGMILGSGAVAQEEERGTLDWLLSKPLKRWQIVAHKAVAIVVLTAGLGVATWLGMALGSLAADMKLNLTRLAEATFSNVLLGLAFAALTLALSCLRGSRGFAAGIAGAVGVASYFINAYAPLVEGLKPYRGWSLFYHAQGAKPLLNGLQWEHAAVMGGVALVLFVVSLFAFERRDVAV